MSYREYIEKRKEAWVGKTIHYQGKTYTVVDVDYNGALHINLPTQFTETTAISERHLDK